MVVYQDYSDPVVTQSVLDAAIAGVGGGGGGAPVGAQYLVGSADATLTAERVVTDTTSITWDLATGGQAKAKRAALTGDVTASADSNATTIAAGAVSTTKLGGDITTAGKALLDDADAAAQRTTLGLAAIAASGSASDLSTGTVPIARIPTGTTSSTVAIGDDSRLSDDRTASGIRTATTTVSVSSATAPTAGQVLTATSGTAADWQTPSGGGGSWTTIVKSVNQSRASTTTNAADDELLFTMLAGNTYIIRGSVFYDTNATPDFKWQLKGSSAPTTARVSRRQIIAGATSYSGIAVDTSLTASQSMAGTGTSGKVEFEAVVVVGGSDITFSFQWSQNTSNAANTTVLAGSYIEYQAA